MMESQVDRELLEKIADLIGKPVGAFNIRKDCGCDGRQSTENIEITGKTDGKSGIDIRVKDGTKGEQCHIPVIITKPGIREMVYNDFYIGENCDVDIVAGCGIHNCGSEESRHDGLHTFYVGKNSHVKYTEKHYGEGDGTGGRIMNPETVVYLEEGASITMETTQIRGIDSTLRKTKIVCGKGAEAVVTERLLTHGEQHAESDMVIPVLRPRPVRLHHHGPGQHPLHPRHHRQLHRGPAHPRGRHRQDRGRPAFEAGDPGSHRGGSRGLHPQRLPLRVSSERK